MANFTAGLSRLPRGSAYRPAPLELLEISVRCYVRGVTTATTAIPLMSDSNAFGTLEQPITGGVKPFDQVPGLRVMPLIGTAWGYFPRVGKKLPGMCTLWDLLE